jgi:hypothetical protein
MRVHLKQILSNKEGKYLFVDIIMMIILAINLFLILFDLSFSSNLVQGFFQKYTPEFYAFYDVHIHQDFLTIDLGFVLIFVIELIIRWIIAVKNHKYHRWFFYPFMHWYDVLGCIPLGSFRFLRVLRIIGLTMRLQKFGVIDLTKTYPYRKFVKYLGIATEEVSDRVVLHVLTGIQKEVDGGTPVLRKIVSDLILPKRDELVNWLSTNIQEATATVYNAHIEELQDYINQKIVTAIDNNPELKIVTRIPVLGSVVTNNLEKTICDMVDSVVDECFQDLASPRNRAVIDDATHLVLDSFMEDTNKQLNDLVEGIVVGALEIIKDQVRIQQWKLQEEFEKETNNAENQPESLELNPQST